MATSVAARLTIRGEPAGPEPVVIKNISAHGACIVAKRACHVADSVVITDLLGTFHLNASVIYCKESRLDSQWAIGLRFNEAGCCL